MVYGQKEKGQRETVNKFKICVFHSKRGIKCLIQMHIFKIYFQFLSVPFLSVRTPSRFESVGRPGYHLEDSESGLIC